MPRGSSIGFGGSVTLIESGLMDAIKKENYKLINRDISTNLEELVLEYLTALRLFWLEKS